MFIALRRLAVFSFLAAGGLLLAACAYRAPVVQGNVVTREQMDVLKTGMSRIQVRDILGTPLVADPFHADRWDYVFTLDQQGLPAQARRLTVFFEGDKLARFESDAELPSETEFAASLGKDLPKKPPSLQADENDLRKFPGPTPKPVAPVPPLPASYPPLEPQS
jgi:outer membrane protein assembly factor BamE